MDDHPPTPPENNDGRTACNHPPTHPPTRKQRRRWRQQNRLDTTWLDKRIADPLEKQNRAGRPEPTVVVTIGGACLACHVCVPSLLFFGRRLSSITQLFSIPFYPTTPPPSMIQQQQQHPLHHPSPPPPHTSSGIIAAYRRATAKATSFVELLSKGQFPSDRDFLIEQPVRGRGREREGRHLFFGLYYESIFI